MIDKGKIYPKGCCGDRLPAKEMQSVFGESLPLSEEAVDFR
jgi:hypothetical protein